MDEIDTEYRGYIVRYTYNSRMWSVWSEGKCLARYNYRSSCYGFIDGTLHRKA